MVNDKIIVCVSASYGNGKELMKEIKKYSSHSDEKFLYWDEFAFTTEFLPVCDAVLVFNSPYENISITCHPEKVICFMMEPGDKNLHPWMHKKLEQYARVYSPVSFSENTILSHGFLGWYLQQDYNYLKNLTLLGKSKNISCIASDLKMLEGHRLRSDFVNLLKQELPQLDFFGKGSDYIPGKIDGLLPYRYSVAIENTSIDNYFTEKINDCFLTYTVPIYYGCKNISKYFPGKSFISIDIKNQAGAVEQIRDIISNDDYQSRIDYLKEARELVLNKYQPLAGAANILREIKSTGKKIKALKPVQPGLSEKIKNVVGKLFSGYHSTKS